MTGKNFDHRKQWIDREVIERWARLFPKSIAASVVSGQSLIPTHITPVSALFFVVAYFFWEMLFNVLFFSYRF